MKHTKYPLYVYVMGKQKAYLHQGNAKTPQEALEQLQHITDEAVPVAVLEVKDYKIFKLLETEGNICPACGYDEDRGKCDCTR